MCPEDGTRLVVAAEDTITMPEVGSVLGHYRLVSRLGEGGVGVLFEAEHVQLGRKMAIKVLHPHLTSEDVVRRLFNEARAVNEIRHPHIIEIEDFVTEPTGEVYLLMELLEGSDLKQVIARDGRLEPERVAHLGAQIADALAAGAELDIVHRDLKPDNVFVIEREGEPDFVKVLDFGIVKFLGDEQGVTHAGMSVGTPEYMPPEQILSGHEVDTRSDIYSLGMVLYEALTGVTAFHDAGPLARVLRAQCYEPAKPPSQVLGEPLPPDLEAVVMSCLEKSPDRRFQDMSELAAALRGEPIAPVMSLENIVAAEAKRSRSRAVRLLLPAMAMAVAAIALLLVRHVHRDRQTHSETLVAAGALDGATSSLSTSLPSTAEQNTAAAPDAAPAVEPAPSPRRSVPAAVEPEQITLQLASDPDGATVFSGVAGDDKLVELGSAPLVTEVPLSTEPLQLVARFADGTEVVQTIVPDREPPRIVFVLPEPTPTPRTARRSTAKPTARAAEATSQPTASEPEDSKPKKIDREGTIDPFAQPSP